LPGPFSFRWATEGNHTNNLETAEEQFGEMEQGAMPTEEMIGRDVSDEKDARELKAGLADDLAELKKRPHSPEPKKKIKALEDLLANFKVYHFTRDESEKLVEGLLRDQPIG
jgi:hypothetical protein